MKKLIYILLILFFISCTNDNDGTKQNLPAITTEGKNTFGCKIDGGIFLPKSSGGFSIGYKVPILYARYFNLTSTYYHLKPGYYLMINAYNELTNKSVRIELEKSDLPLYEGKIYPIALKTDGLINANYSFSTTTPHPGYNNVFIYESHEFNSTNEHTGEIKIIKIDETNLIISGIFSFDCINNSDNKVAKISEGRFDIKYEPYPN